jgi:hypothetical protein
MALARLLAAIETKRLSFTETGADSQAGGREFSDGVHVSEPSVGWRQRFAATSKSPPAWPDAWQIDDGDLRYGEQLLEELKPFVMYLVGVEKLARSTVRRHLDNLFLLGGELISHINIYEKDRKLSPACLLDDNLCEDRGPLCKHVEDGSDQQQYDAACKKLHSFRSARSRTHKIR